MDGMKQKGFSLIEVLIAMAVTGVGLLGFIQIQFIALRAAQNAGHQFTASLLIQDLMGRMQTPFDQTLNYKYDSKTPAIARNPNCYGGKDGLINCTQAEMIKEDLLSWTQAVADNLPFGRALICNQVISSRASAKTVTCQPPQGSLPQAQLGSNPYTIIIYWSTDGGLTFNNSFTSPDQLKSTSDQRFQPIPLGFTPPGTS